jgi:lysozyme
MPFDGRSLIDEVLAHALPVIAYYEGCAARVPATGLFVPYLCPAGYWTIGYGRLVPREHPPITHGEAREFLKTDTVRHLRMAIELSPVLARYPQRFAAITSFVFNLGPGNYRASTLRRCVNAEDWPGARVQILRWVRGGGRVLPGLVRRREAEAAML